MPISGPDNRPVRIQESPGPTHSIGSDSDASLAFSPLPSPISATPASKPLKIHKTVTELSKHEGLPTATTDLLDRIDSLADSLELVIATREREGVTSEQVTRVNTLVRNFQEIAATDDVKGLSEREVKQLKTALHETTTKATMAANWLGFETKLLNARQLVVREFDEVSLYQRFELEAGLTPNTLPRTVEVLGQLRQALARIIDCYGQEYANVDSQQNPRLKLSLAEQLSATLAEAADLFSSFHSMLEKQIDVEDLAGLDKESLQALAASLNVELGELHALDHVLKELPERPQEGVAAALSRAVSEPTRLITGLWSTITHPVASIQSTLDYVDRTAPLPSYRPSNLLRECEDRITTELGVVAGLTITSCEGLDKLLALVESTLADTTTPSRVESADSEVAAEYTDWLKAFVEIRQRQHATETLSIAETPGDKDIATVDALQDDLVALKDQLLQKTDRFKEAGLEESTYTDLVAEVDSALDEADTTLHLLEFNVACHGVAEARREIESSIEEQTSALAGGGKNLSTDNEHALSGNAEELLRLLDDSMAAALPDLARETVFLRLSISLEDINFLRKAHSLEYHDAADAQVAATLLTVDHTAMALNEGSPPERDAIVAYSNAVMYSGHLLSELQLGCQRLTRHAERIHNTLDALKQKEGTASGSEKRLLNCLQDMYDSVQASHKQLNRQREALESNTSLTTGQQAIAKLDVEVIEELARSPMDWFDQIDSPTSDDIAAFKHQLAPLFLFTGHAANRMDTLPPRLTDTANALLSSAIAMLAEAENVSSGAMEATPSYDTLEPTKSSDMSWGEWFSASNFQKRMTVDLRRRNVELYNHPVDSTENTGWGRTATKTLLLALQLSPSIHGAYDVLSGTAGQQLRMAAMHARRTVLKDLSESDRDRIDKETAMLGIMLTDKFDELDNSGTRERLTKRTPGLRPALDEIAGSLQKKPSPERAAQIQDAYRLERSLSLVTSPSPFAHQTVTQWFTALTTAEADEEPDNLPTIPLERTVTRLSSGQPHHLEPEAEALDDGSVDEAHLATESGVVSGLWAAAQSALKALSGVASLTAPTGQPDIITETSTRTSASADLNIPDEFGFTPLTRAARDGDIEAIRVLIEGGADLDLADETGETPLTIAANEGQVDAVNVLAMAGADVDLPNLYGDTPLLRAVKRGRIELMTPLMTGGANLNLSNRVGETPLAIAVTAKTSEAVELLLEGGANPNLRDSEGWSLLTYAARSGNTEAIELLLKAGAAADVPTKAGITPLEVVLKDRNHAAMRLLIAAGADVNQRASEGQTPLLMRALDREDLVAFELLLEMGADPDLPDKKGRTPLMHATKKGFTDTVRLLITKGVKLEPAPGVRTSALLEATLRGHREIIEILVRAGADTSRKNRWQWTAAIDCEAKQIFEDCAELFGPDPYSKEALHEKMLGHVFEIGGVAVLEGVTLARAGFHSPYWSNHIIDTLTKFNDQYPGELSDATFKLLSSTLTDGVRHRRQADAPAIVARYQSGEPVAIHTGYSGHAVEVFLWGDALVIANKGGHTRSPIEVHTINREKVNDATVTKILALETSPSDDYATWLRELPTTFDARKSPLHDQLIAAYPFSHRQEVGNCSWESVETAVYALMAMQALSEGDTRTPRERRNALQEVNRVFQSWLQFTQLEALEAYFSDHEKDAEDRYGLDHELVQSIFSQIWKVPSWRIDLYPRMQALETRYTERSDVSAINFRIKKYTTWLW